jgi:hypothetical protein
MQVDPLSTTMTPPFCRLPPSSRWTRPLLRRLAASLGQHRHHHAHVGYPHPTSTWGEDLTPPRPLACRRESCHHSRLGALAPRRIARPAWPATRPLDLSPLGLIAYDVQRAARPHNLGLRPESACTVHCFSFFWKCYSFKYSRNSFKLPKFM